MYACFRRRTSSRPYIRRKIEVPGTSTVTGCTPGYRFSSPTHDARKFSSTLLESAKHIPTRMTHTAHILKNRTPRYVATAVHRTATYTRSCYITIQLSAKQNKTKHICSFPHTLRCFMIENEKKRNTPKINNFDETSNNPTNFLPLSFCLCAICPRDANTPSN